jgi:hypothetical protein
MEKGGIMTRKDSEKDSDRPHYFSQFWLDIAAGRREIGGPRPEDAEADELDVPEPAPARKAGRNSAASLRETRASAIVEPAVEEEEFEQEDEVDEDELPNIVLDEVSEPEEEIIEEDEIVEEPEEEEFYEEEEEEDEEEWGRGRKKPKPIRQAVKPAKKPKREPRRSF